MRIPTPLRNAILIGHAMAAAALVPDAHAQWLPGGIPVTAESQSDIPIPVRDSQGGLYVAWRDYRSGDGDTYLQRLSPEGFFFPGWPSGGLLIATGPASQTALHATSDEAGGVIVAWTNQVVGGNDLRAIRILPDGTVASGWANGGILVAGGDGWQDPWAMLSDGGGGAYVTWTDDPGSPGGPTSAFVQHLNFAGASHQGWPALGQAILTTPGSHDSPELVTDGAGGVICIASEHGGALPGTQTGRGSNHSAVRFLPSGELASGWPAEGTLLLRTLSSVEVRKACTDGAGGAYFAWNDNRFAPDPTNPFHYDIYAQHILADGQVDPRWPADGLPIADGPSGQYDFDIAPDGNGGAFLAWEEFRAFDGWKIYAKRILPDGATGPGWAQNGNRVSSRDDTEFFPKVISDDMGGFWVVWEVSGSPPSQRYVHMGRDGQVAHGWTMEGELLAFPSFSPTPIRDGEHGMFVVFEQHNDGPGVWAQRIYGDGVTSTLPSLVSAVAQAGQATLRWSTPAALSNFRVQRRTEIDPWAFVGAPHESSPGLLEFVDRELPGGRYAFRLVYSEGGRDHATTETWLDVEANASLTLAGFRPNPATGSATILAFALPDERPARLELIDVKGRIVHSQEVGDLGAGSHLVSLSGESSLGTGMYWIRLSHPLRTLTTKGLVVR